MIRQAATVGMMMPGFDYDREVSKMWAFWTAQGTESDNFLPTSGNPKSRFVEQNNGFHMDQAVAADQLTLFTTGANSINENPGIASTASSDHLESASVLDGDFLTNQSTSYTLLIPFKQIQGTDDFPKLFGTVKIGSKNNGFELMIHEPLSKVYITIWDAAAANYYGGIDYKPDAFNAVCVRYNLGVGFVMDIINVDEVASFSSGDFTAIVPDPDCGFTIQTYSGDAANSIGEIQIAKEYKSDAWVAAMLNNRYDHYKAP